MMMNNIVILMIVLTIVFCTTSTTEATNIRTCGVVDKTKEEEEKIASQVSKYLATARSISEDDEIVIDVYWHVMMKKFGGDGDVSDEVIQESIDILNDAYAGVHSRYAECSEAFTYQDFPSTPFRFELKKILRHKNTLAFFSFNPFAFLYRRMKRIGTCADLNVYSANFFALGFATFPADCPRDGRPDCPARGDGVVIHHQSVPGGAMESYDQGDTLVHEVGHWLGLYHTFQGGCDGAGDEIADTPPQDEATYGCPSFQDSCEGGGTDPVHNYMDYSDDCCMYRFTKGQVDRMVAHAGAFRGLTGTNNATTSRESEEIQDNVFNKT